MPLAFGTVQDRHVGGSTNVILIQDAHSQTGAQQHIDQLLGDLESRYGVKTLFLEGAFQGRLPADLMHFDKDPRVNAALAGRLFDKGLVSGAGRYLFEHPKGMEGYGVETPDLYVRNVKQFRAIYKMMPEADRFLEVFRESLQSAASRAFNPDLRKFHREWAAYLDSHREIQSYFDQLGVYAKRCLQLDLRDTWNQFDYPQLVRFFALQKLEKAAAGDDPEKTEREKKTLREWLGSLAARPGTKSAVHRFVKTDQVFLDVFFLSPDDPLLKDPRTFFEQFYVRYHPHGFTFEQYPGLMRRIGRNILAKELDARLMGAEADRLTEKLLEKLAVSSKEKRLVELFKGYWLLRKLFALELDRQDYRDITKNRKDLLPSVMIEGFKSRPLDRTLELDRLFERALEFYQTSVRREEVMFSHMLDRLKEKHIKNSVLVVGGFHSEGLEAMLRDQGLSYVSVTPKITKLESSQNYLGSMLLQNAKSATRSTVPAESPDRISLTELGGYDVAGANFLAGIVRAELRELRRSPGLHPSPKVLREASPSGISAPTLLTTRSEARPLWSGWRHRLGTLLIAGQVGIGLGGLLAVNSAEAGTGRARFSWEQVLNTATALPEPTVKGYKVHWGTESGVYTQVQDAGNNVEVIIEGFEEGREYFSAVTAYDLYGAESGYSSEISFIYDTGFKDMTEYAEDFHGDHDDVDLDIRHSQEWNVSGDKLIFTSGEHDSAALTYWDVEERDYRLSITTRFGTSASDNARGLIGWYQDADNYIYGVADRGRNVCEIIHLNQGMKNVLGSVAMPLAADNRDHVIRFRRTPQGTFVLGFNNNPNVLTVSDPVTTDGKVGIFSEKNPVQAISFDDLDLIQYRGVGTTNASPEISGISGRTINENATGPWTFNFTVGDDQTPAENLTVTATSSNPVVAPNSNLLLAGSGATRAVTVTGVLGAGETAIKLRVSDGKTTKDTSFVLTVNAWTSWTATGHTFTVNGSNTSIVPDPLAVGGTAGHFSSEGSNLVFQDSPDWPSGANNFKIDLHAYFYSPHLPAPGNSKIFLAQWAPGEQGFKFEIYNDAGTYKLRFKYTTNNVDTEIAEAVVTPASDTWNQISVERVGQDLTFRWNGSTVGTYNMGDDALYDAATPLIVGGSVKDPENFVGKMYGLEIGKSGGEVLGLAFRPAEYQQKSEVIPMNGARTPPTISAIQNQETNRAPATVAFTVGDADSLDGLTLTATTVNSTTEGLVPAEGLVFGGSGAERTLTITPAPGKSGRVTVVVNLSNGQQTYQRPFVLDVNDAPTITPIADQTMTPEAPSLTIPFTVADTETPVGNLTVGGMSYNRALVPDENIVVTNLGGGNWTATLTPVAGQTGTAEIKVSASDGAKPGIEKFKLTVSSHVQFSSAVLTNNPDYTLVYTVNGVEKRVAKTLVEGINTLTVTENGITKEFMVTLDTSAPVVVVDVATPKRIYVNAITVSYTVEGVEKQKTFTGLKEGVNTLTITETDLAGNERVVSFNVTVDTILPDLKVAISEVPAGIRLSIREIDGGISYNIQYSDDGMRTWKTVEEEGVPVQMIQSDEEPGMRTWIDVNTAGVAARFYRIAITRSETRGDAKRDPLMFSKASSATDAMADAFASVAEVAGRIFRADLRIYLFERILARADAAGQNRSWPRVLETLGAIKTEALLRAVFPERRSDGTLKPFAHSADGNRSLARGALGMRHVGEKRLTDVLILGEQFVSQDPRVMPGMRAAFRGVLIVAIVNTPRQRSDLRDLNRLLAKEGQLPILAAESPDELRAHLKNSRGTVRATALLFGTESLSDELRSLVPNSLRVTQRMLKGFLNAIDSIVSDLVRDLQALRATAKSA